MKHQIPLIALFQYPLRRPPRRGKTGEHMVRVWFSEEVAVSYRTIRDTAFVVTGGEVVWTRRLYPPGNQWWGVYVQASGYGPVQVVLPVTTDCEASGVICTESGTMLSTHLSITLAGSDD